MASGVPHNTFTLHILSDWVSYFTMWGGLNLCPQDTKNDPIFKRETDLESNTVVESDTLSKKITPNVSILF